MIVSTNFEQLGTAAVTPALTDPASLVRFCDAVLPTLRLDDGMYCFDRTWADPALRGRSPRYTLMVALGLARAEAAGYDLAVSATELADLVFSDPAPQTPGDRGLLLWLLSRLGDDRAGALVTELEGVATDQLVPLEGMEIGWLVTGAACAVGAGLVAEKLLDTMLGQLWSRQAFASPLFHHQGTGRGRALLPNFATQIYSVLALAEVARATGDARAVTAATSLADLLLERRGADAGWPWLFHAERATVVERYQIYSVHQDAMAPMAYFALSEVTGDPRHATAGAEGLPWCFGHNEMEFSFYDGPNRFAHRAIKRQGAADRGGLWANTGLALAGVRRRADMGSVEVNDTCRPYHLGWIIEAWAGREQHIELLGRTS